MKPAGCSYNFPMARILVYTGIILIALGLLWPWLQKSGFGRLPGDIFIDKGSFRFYFPITTSLIISLIITLIFWMFRR